MQQQQARLVELETLRVDFKRHHDDRAGSVFTDDAVIPQLLAQFLAGMLDSKMVSQRRVLAFGGVM